jgi:hypothetical protein
MENPAKTTSPTKPNLRAQPEMERQLKNWRERDFEREDRVRFMAAHYTHFAFGRQASTNGLQGRAQQP